MISVQNGSFFVFQLDSAPLLKAQATQEWLAKNFHGYKNIWPPNSPDFNLLDY